MTLYRKVFTKDRLPDKPKVGVEIYSTDRGLSFDFDVPECEWWLEEIDFPSEEEVDNECECKEDTESNDYIGGVSSGVYSCYMYILNKLKG